MILWTLIGGIRGVGIAVAAAAITASALMAYDVAVDDPAVRREARAGLVAVTELSAARAQLAEARRQIAAGQATLREHQSRYEADQRAFAAAEARMEQELATNEAELAAANRSCTLSGDDIRFLRKP